MPINQFHDLFQNSFHDDPALEMAFCQNALDRSTEHRKDDAVAIALSDQNARLHLFDDDRVLTDISTKARVSFTLQQARDFGVCESDIILLGHQSDGTPLLAGRFPSDDLPDDGHHKAISIRSLGQQALVNEANLGSLAQGRSLTHWHHRNQFCPNCGTPTTSALGGARRDCPSCEAIFFPRTDPVVIMLAVHGDKCLLGDHGRYEGKMYSTLAGFMEQGETIEAAVRREIFEEAGIKINRVRYLTSQPWPFPASLMIGCYAEAASTDITLDETELVHAKWFTRDEVRNFSNNENPDKPYIPGEFSISSYLIRCWLNSA